MQVTVVKPDNKMAVDGVWKDVDLSFLPDHFHAFQFNGNAGHLESTDPDQLASFQNVTEWADWSKAEAAYKAAPLPIVEEEEIVEEEAEPEQEPVVPPSQEQIMMMFRNERDNKLTECDWIVTKALENGEAVPEDWKLYRSTLRNLPDEIENGKYPKPTWDAEAMMVSFPNWPVPPFELGGII
jgi:hypothetical protein